MKFIVRVQQALKKKFSRDTPPLRFKTIMNDLRWGHSPGGRMDDEAVAAEAAKNIFNIVIG